MEEFDDDDFSDLYADVEVQASSAISALHRSIELPANAARGEKKAADERGAAREEEKKGDLRNISAENGDRCESRSASWSESESERQSEDGLASDGDDGVEKKVDESYERKKCDDRALDVGFGTISGKENSANGGDYGSQRKYNSLNSKAKRVHETAQHGACRNRDSNDRSPIFSRATEDNNGRKHGESKITSERHEEVSYPAPLDSDKRGSVQISDSGEDSPSEVSECDSDGTSETSDDTDRRKASCTPNKVSSALKPESCERGWSQRRQDYSRSSRAALNSRSFKKSHERSRRSSSSLHCDSEEPISHKHHPHKDTESCGVRRGTRDGRYRERWINSAHEHSNHPKRSNYMHYFKNQPDEDASYAINAKHLPNRHVNHGNQRETTNLKYNEVDFPYCSHSERKLTYSSGRFPDHHLGPAFLKDQYWDPGCRYRAGLPDGRSMSERQIFLNQKSSPMDYETLGYNRYHNQRRHHFQGDIEGLRNLSLKYSSAVDQRGTQFMYKGEGVHPRRRTRQDYLSPPHDYDEERYRRLHPCSEGDRDHDHGRRIQPDRANCNYDRDIAHDRREVGSFGRGKRRRNSPLNRENLCYTETEANDRRNIGHRSFPFYSSEEPYGSGWGEFLGASGPNSGVAQRNMRCSWKEMHIECDQYGTDVTTFVARESLGYHLPEDFNVRRSDYRPSLNTNVMRESNKVNQYQDHFVGRRCHQLSEVLFPREDVHKSRQQKDIDLGSEEPSHSFIKKSKNDKADNRPAFGRDRKLNERETDRQNSNILRDEDNSNHSDGSHKSTKLNTQTHPSHQDTVDSLMVVGRKCTLQSSIRRTTEAGEDTFYGKFDLGGWTDNKEPNNLEDLNECKPDKTVPSDERKVDSTLSNMNQQNEFLDIEEGQIITEEMKNEDASHINALGQRKTTSNGNALVEKLDDEKIKEIMMKMERRRERFKKPISLSRDGEKTSSLLLDSNIEPTEARLERPARKRRWLGT